MKKLTITLITFCLSLSAFGQQTIRIDISQLDMTGFSRQDIFIRFDSFNRRLPTDEDIFTVEVKNLPTILELRTLKKRKFTSEKMFWIEQLEVPLQGSIAEKTLSISSGSPDLQIITDKIKSNFKPDPAREREMAYSKPVLVHLNRQRFFLKNDYLEKLISLAPPKVKEFWAFADLETYLKHQKAVGYNPDTKVFTHLTAINTEQNKQEVRLTGDKPILVDFSSTSCRPCLVDIPKMAAIHQEFSNQLDMLTVWNDPTYETWTRVAAQRKALIVWNSLWDKSGVIYKRFDIKVLPTYMLFDQDGKLLKTWHKPPRNIEKYL